MAVVAYVGSFLQMMLHSSVWVVLWHSFLPEIHLLCKLIGEPTCWAATRQKSFSAERQKQDVAAS